MGGIAKTIAGANIKVLINDATFGICTHAEFTSGTGRRAIFGLDSVTAFELAPGQQTVSGRMDCTRIKLSGGLEGFGVVAPSEKILLEKYITITLIERSTGSILFRCEQAAVDTQNWVADARGIMRGSFVFTGIAWFNEIVAAGPT